MFEGRRNYHCGDETDPGSESCGKKSGDSCKKIRPKENRAERDRLNAEAQIEPIGCKTLHDEPTRKCIKGKEGGYFQDDASRPGNSENVCNA
jgi:hypothetical protein